MVPQKFLIACVLAVAIAAVQVHSVLLADKREQSRAEIGQSDALVDGHGVKRTGRIMKVLKDPNGNPGTHSKRIRITQNPQSRRDRFPPPGPQRPGPIVYHRSPAQPPFTEIRNQVLRRVQSGPPPNTFLRPQFQQQPPNYEKGKGTRFHLNGKENNPPFNAGKGAVYRPQFGSVSHPNALPPQGNGNAQQQFTNFKASPQYSGAPIVRPASDFPQYAKLLQEYKSYQGIKQHPLPQQHPQHQFQQQQFSEFPQQHSPSNTAPQTFPELQPQPAKAYTEPLLQSAGSSDSAHQMYSVYEDSELSDRAPVQFNANQQQNPRPYDSSAPPQELSEASSPMAAEEAEEYLRFMSTNEYFLPKFNPNYKKLDEEKDMRVFKQQQKHPSQSQQLLPYGKTQTVADTSSSATFQHPIEVSQLYYHPDASPASTIVRGSYQAGNNAFVVKSDGNNAVKHVVPNSVASLSMTTPSIASSYTQPHYNQQRHRTPEPIRYEFTERDAVLAGHTNTPPSNGHLRYKGVHVASIPSQSGLYGSQAASFPSTTAVVNHNRPISVNEVDADPEDGDDMHDTGTGTFGRVPIRSSTESISGVALNGGSSSTTPATEQKDTEEYCERMCANVQDDDEEIICGSDGYMYTGEAQMECYASCLHIEVTIQGKGTCSAR